MQVSSIGVATVTALPREVLCSRYLNHAPVFDIEMGSKIDALCMAFQIKEDGDLSRPAVRIASISTRVASLVRRFHFFIFLKLTLRHGIAIIYQNVPMMC